MRHTPSTYQPTQGTSLDLMETFNHAGSIGVSHVLPFQDQMGIHSGALSRTPLPTNTIRVTQAPLPTPFRSGRAHTGPLPCWTGRYLSKPAPFPPGPTDGLSRPARPSTRLLFILLKLLINVAVFKAVAMATRRAPLCAHTQAWKVCGSVG